MMADETSTVQLRLGFIGLGIMGKPMAKNLLRSGCPLVVHNRSAEAVRELEAIGATGVSSPKEVAEAADLIVLMLPDSPDVEIVISGEGGMMEAELDGKIVVDMSSIHPDSSRRMSELLGGKGAFYLDAPVSGGETGAIEAKLAIMVGGPKDIFGKARPVLELMGASIHHVGEVGAGNTVKLMNQMMVAAHIAALSEAVAFGRKAGIDPLVAYQAIRGGLAGSKVMDMKINHLAGQQFEPGFRVELHAKDLRNALAKGEAVGARMMFAPKLLEWLEELSDEGYAKEDHSALYRKYMDKGDGTE